MSQANLPNITPTIDITRKDAITLIIASIAMEELGLSHILNAEGEKLQYVLGTLPGVSAPAVTLSDLLAVNDSIRKTLKVTTNKDWVLKQKLETAICASDDPVGPVGPTCVPVMSREVILCGPTLESIPVIRCMPVNYDGPTPCVPLSFASNAPCVPVPPPGCVLSVEPTGVTCIPISAADEILLKAPRC
ncbi:hypothetical protein ACE3NQ_01460 [Paenibacillus terreus]|uniref:Uncharacterized protein n=1 Tax=Paenibacillus terreus TaxID=1387834 RepID=A0ABV5B1M1_9BACL